MFSTNLRDALNPRAAKHPSEEIPATPGTSLTFVCWLASSCVATSGSIIKKLWTIGCLPLDPGTFLIVFVWDGSDGSVDHLSGQWSIARLGCLPAQKKTWHQRQRGPGVPAKRVTNFSNSDLWPTWVAAPLNGPWFKWSGTSKHVR